MPFRHLGVRGQGRTGHHLAHGADINHLVGNTLGLAHGARRLQLPYMALAVIERQRMDLQTPGTGQVEQGKRVHASGINNDNSVSHGNLTTIAGGVSQGVQS